MSPQPPMGNGVDDRCTPRDLFDRLDAEHHFTLDAAASHENALLPRYCTLDGAYEKVQLETGSYYQPLRATPASRKMDGLSYSWDGERVFINPPYGRGLLAPFVAKAAVETGSLGACQLVVALLPVRTEQPWFHAFVYDGERRCWRPGVSLEFVEKRIKYDGLSTGAPFPSMIVTWRPPA